MSLKNQAIKGISWNLIERFGLQAIQLILGVWLARLLTPTDYGLIGMISVFFIVASVFVESGFQTAYVQKKKVTDIDANTVFYSNLIISLICYAGLWCAAPAISEFYNQQKLVNLTRVMGSVVVINAFNLIQMAQLTRAINFKLKAKITLTATLISGVFGISSALLGLGVWSLVVQQMTNRILTTLCMWILSSWRPGLKLSMESLRNLFSFGFWVLMANLLQKIFDNIYLLTIGKFFPAAQLGFYTKSKGFSSQASQQLATAVGVVAFPFLSRMQHDPARLKVWVQNFLTHTMVFTAPVLVTVIVVAKPFVLVLLTEKWAPMIPYMQLLCIVGFFYPIHLVNVQVLIAQGKSNLHFRITIIKNILRIANIVLMYRFGVICIILGEIVTSLLTLAVNTYYTKILLGYGFFAQLKDLKQIAIITVAAGLFGMGVVYSIQNLFISLMTGIVITMGSYVILQLVFNKVFFWNLIRLKEVFVK